MRELLRNRRFWRVFVGALPTSMQKIRRDDDVRRRVLDSVRRAARRWPDARLYGRADFLATKILNLDSPEVFTHLALDDLWLALASSSGSQAAREEFLRDHVRAASRARVVAHLLSGSSPRLLGYCGRVPLRAWVIGKTIQEVVENASGSADSPRP
jgi:hypothetical protein